MRFRRARLSAKRFIAGVGGTKLTRHRRPRPEQGVPPASAPSFSLPMMRWATSHTASIAPIISCLPTKTSSSRHSNCAVTRGSTSAGSACLRTPNSDRPVSVGTYVLSLGFPPPPPPPPPPKKKKKKIILVLDFRIVQLRSLAVAQRWKQLRLVALFVGRLPIWERCAPTEIDRLSTR